MVVICGEEEGYICDGAYREGSGRLAKFYFLTWVLVTRVFVL